MVRGALAVAAALLMAVAVVRNALVAEFVEVRPERALGAWPGHPRAELWTALTKIAAATRAGQAVEPQVLQSVTDAAGKDPLAPEPFLVRGIAARLAGDETIAADAYRAAELRDGRSVPARYFLADHYLRIGDGADGLRESAMLARMIPNGVASLAPFIASYAKDPANRPQLSAMFRSNSSLAGAALGVLAQDPRNSDLVLRLAPPSSPGAPQPWRDALISSLVASGDYAKAYQMWSAVARVPASGTELIHDPGFQDPSSPAPFNWALTSSGLGLAERQPGGRLHIVYYAQDDGVLASQLLVLKPGRYQLAMRVAGDLRNAGLLSWKVDCEDSKVELLKLRAAASTQGSFAVPPNCAAQRLELVGSAPDLAQAVDVTISGLSLTRDGANG